MNLWIPLVIMVVLMYNLTPNPVENKIIKYFNYWIDKLFKQNR